MDCLAYCHRSPGTSHTSLCYPDDGATWCPSPGCCPRAAHSFVDPAGVDVVPAADAVAARAFHSSRSRASAKWGRGRWVEVTFSQRAQLTWLTSCWNAGVCVLMAPLLSRSACRAKSLKAFHGGWYVWTSKPCRFSGESCRTGELAIIGMPCMAP